MTSAKTTRHVTASEIAVMSGVSPSAVSNWRMRHKNFPRPIQSSASHDLFQLEEVQEWLQATGRMLKVAEPPSSDHLPSVFWRWAALTRDSAEPLLSLEAFLRVLLVRSRLSARAWREVVSGPPDRLTVAIEHELAKSFHESLLGSIIHSTRILEELNGRLTQQLVALVNEIPEDRLSDLERQVPLLVFRVLDTSREGGFATPPSVSALLAQLLKPIVGDVYDPASGSGGLLASLWRHREEGQVRLYGQEINAALWRLGTLQLALIGADFDPGPVPSDIFEHDVHQDLRASRIALDPPWGQQRRDVPHYSDPRWAFGTPSKGSLEWAWAQHAIWHLAEDGIAAMTCAPGALFRSGAEASVRRGIIEADLIDAVVQLPPGLLSVTSIPPCIVIFDRQRVGRAGKILFLDASRMGETVERTRSLSDEDIAEIAAAVTDWRSGTFAAKPGFSSVAEIRAVLAEDAILSPSRYVQYRDRKAEIAGEPVSERLDRLVGEARQRLAATASALDDVVSWLERSGSE